MCCRSNLISFNTIHRIKIIIIMISAERFISLTAMVDPFDCAILLLFAFFIMDYIYRDSAHHKPVVVCEKLNIIFEIIAYKCNKIV